MRRKYHTAIVEHTRVLALASTLLVGLQVIGQTSTCVVQGVHEQQGCTTSKTTSSDVFSEVHSVWVSLFQREQRFDATLEGEVKRLRWEVTEAIGEVGTPESTESFILHDPVGTVTYVARTQQLLSSC